MIGKVFRFVSQIQCVYTAIRVVWKRQNHALDVFVYLLFTSHLDTVSWIVVSYFVLNSIYKIAENPIRLKRITVVVLHDAGSAEFAAHRYVGGENQSAWNGVNGGEEANAISSPVPLVTPDFSAVVHVGSNRNIYFYNVEK